MGEQSVYWKGNEKRFQRGGGRAGPFLPTFFPRWLAEPQIFFSPRKRAGLIKSGVPDKKRTSVAGVARGAKTAA